MWPPPNDGVGVFPQCHGVLCFAHSFCNTYFVTGPRGWFFTVSAKTERARVGSDLGDPEAPQPEADPFAATVTVSDVLSVAHDSVDSEWTV